MLFEGFLVYVLLTMKLSKVRSQLTKRLSPRGCDSSLLHRGQVFSRPSKLKSSSCRSYSEMFPFNQVPVFPPLDPTHQPKEEWLSRDFVANHLYKKTESYFTKSAPVHFLRDPLQFNKMWGHSDYQKVLYDIYEDIDGFMTPVEIFKPYYAQAIAKYMIDVLERRGQIDSFSSTNPFALTEVGGGNGSCAVGILDFLRDNYPQLYENTQYEIIDVSKPFHNIQKQVLAGHSSKVKLKNQNFFDCRDSSKAHGFFIGLEILDNLPHDKLVVDDQGILREIWVQTKPDKIVVDPFTKTPVQLPPYVEAKRPLKDPQILAYLRLVCNHYGLDSSFLTTPDPLNHEGNRMIPPPQDFITPHLILWHLLRYPSLAQREQVATGWGSFLSKKIDSSLLSLDTWKRELSHFGAISGGVSTDNIYFLPTCQMMMLHTIANKYPNRDIIMNDFDKIVGGMHGINAPLVQRTEGNETATYSTYIGVPPGQVDIFYPTNFEQLSVIQYQLSDKKVGYHCTTKQFMKTYANTKATQTRTLYNPLLNDFVNTRFFLTAKPPFMPDIKN